MSVFQSYAQYYDFLYRDKDYGGETEFIRGVLQRVFPTARTVLELGCGTGGHAEHLAKAGFRIHGVDLSSDMLAQAEDRRSGLSPELQSRLKFDKGDIRKLRLGRKFDIVLGLFHVMSYQVSNDDLLSTFTTAREHLNEGGVFLFDCWYGPAVLSDRPEVRVKRLENEEIDIIRIANPVLHPNDNAVDVNYQVIMRRKDTDVCEEISETHRMRYLFRPEVEELSSQAGFQVEDFGTWMNDEEPGLGSWSVFFVVKRNSS